MCFSLMSLDSVYRMILVDLLSENGKSVIMSIWVDIMLNGHQSSTTSTVTVNAHRYKDEILKHRVRFFKGVVE